jgi:hypothetical protein
VDRIVTNECSEAGVIVNTPVVATRVGDVPPSVVTQPPRP